MEQYKGIAFEQEDIKSLEKVEGRQFSNPINPRNSALLPKANEESKDRKDLKLFDKNNIDRGNGEVIGIPPSFYEALLEPLRELKEPYEKLLEALLGRYPQYIEEKVVDELPSYEDFVRLIHGLLERYGKTPIDLTYDLLNEMARELYESAPKTNHEEAIDFRLDFSDRKTLGRQLRQLRESLGIGLRELGRAIPYSQGDLSEIELGYPRRRPTPSLIYKYLLGCRKRLSSKRVSYR